MIEKGKGEADATDFPSSWSNLGRLEDIRCAIYPPAHARVSGTPGSKRSGLRSDSCEDGSEDTRPPHLRYMVVDFRRQL